MITTPTPQPILLLLLLAAMIPAFDAATDTLSANQSMTANQSLVSAAGTFKLGFFYPGDAKHRYLAIWYNKIPLLTAVWVANRQPALPESGGSLMLHINGTLVLTDDTGVVYWSAGGAGATDGVPVATLLDSGNLVVKDGKGSVVWQSFDYPSDTILPGMKLGRDLRRGLVRGCTAWLSAGNPAPGPNTMFFDFHGVPELLLNSSSTQKWRSGPWNGRHFGGIPEMGSYKGMFTFEYVVTKDETFYRYNVTNPQVMARLYVTSDGVAERVVWIEDKSAWNSIWTAPKDQCDSVSTCGPFGICDPNAAPICDCLQGFRPKSDKEWYLRYGTDGCMRDTPLDCQNMTDGFVVVGGVKLPGTSNATVDYNMSLNDCRTKCLGNCSCTAYAAADIYGDISGCIIWVGELTGLRVYVHGGQDLFVRLAAKDLGSKSNSLNTGVRAAIMVCAVISVILMGWGGALLWKKNKAKRRDMLGATMMMDEHHRMEVTIGRDVELPVLEFSTVAAATDDFSLRNKLGEGGFGPVYKGKLEEGTEVAIKRLGRNSMQGMDEFKNEVMLIAKLQHRNLVRLLGCCVHGEERMLIYEFMSNGSLDAFLFDRTKASSLDWRTRYQIIMGIARGLLYLHRDSRFRIIHRDLKASNILLDEQMNPKISDFGMARIFGGDDTQTNTKRVVGTYGYMSPEYAMDGVFSVKSDVFSFGVLVLEIISGERNRGIYPAHPEANLVGHTWNLWKEGRSIEIADKLIQHSHPLSEIMKCIKLALLCAQERPEDRPTMSSVVLILGSDDVHMPQPKQPGFTKVRSSMEMYSSSGRQETGSGNYISMTTLDGR